MQVVPGQVCRDRPRREHIHFEAPAAGRILEKAARRERLNAVFEPNERQRKVINSLLDGAESDVSTSRYARLAGVFLDTAPRDIDRMVRAGAAIPSERGGRSRKCTLAFADA